MSAIEVTLLRSLPWLFGGLLAALLALLGRKPLTAGPRIIVFTVHLSAMLGLVLVASLTLAPLTSAAWFQGSGLSEVSRQIASGVFATLLLTTGIAIVSIASSAALGYPPSLSYLQLLSAADAGMATAGVAIGLSWMAGPVVTSIGALLMAAVCVWSIWCYLDKVGFTDEGGWLVDRQALWRYVYPFDLAALALVIVALTMGALLAPPA